MGWTKREEINLPSSRNMIREGKADRLQKGKKKKKKDNPTQNSEEKDMKDRIWERKDLSSMDYFVLCAKAKNTREALTETVSAPLLFRRQSAGASAEMCIFSIHCNRNIRIVSLMN